MVHRKRMEIWREIKEPFQNGYRLENLSFDPDESYVLVWDFRYDSDPIGLTKALRKEDDARVTGVVELFDKYKEVMSLDELCAAGFFTNINRRKATEEEKKEVGVTQDFDVIYEGTLRAVSLILPDAAMPAGRRD